MSTGIFFIIGSQMANRWIPRKIKDRSAGKQRPVKLNALLTQPWSHTFCCTGPVHRTIWNTEDTSVTVIACWVCRLCPLLLKCWKDLVPSVVFRES